jgi:hypothetical protein
MEGTPSKLPGRWIGARPAAVLLTLGALVVGLAACGSNASTSATGSTSSVAKKEAGYKDVQLTVVNKNPKTVFVTACEDDPDFYGHGTCRASGDLATGESLDLTKAAVGGSILFRGDNTVEYAAKNPDVGKPSIRLWLTASSETDTNQNQHDADRFYLSEGQTVETNVGGHLFDMARGDDTDFKVMTLTVR